VEIQAARVHRPIGIGLAIIPAVTVAMEALVANLALAIASLSQPSGGSESS
jgi:hypothetical protein